MKIQAKEEIEHAMKFYEFINDRGGKVELYKIERPPANWQSVTEVFRKALEHEKLVTKHINDLVDLAKKLGNKPTEVFLHLFVTEQVKEEKTFQDILQILEFTGEVS
ncbi:MAG: ferritin [Caldisphaeraceae archaeon]|nr:ferritin [Caldisphaeraceae archaeon]